jgi:hypothetical protein
MWVFIVIYYWSDVLISLLQYCRFAQGLHLILQRTAIARSSRTELRSLTRMTRSLRKVRGALWLLQLSINAKLWAILTLKKLQFCLSTFTLRKFLPTYKQYVKGCFNDQVFGILNSLFTYRGYPRFSTFSLLCHPSRLVFPIGITCLGDRPGRAAWCDSGDLRHCCCPLVSHNVEAN